MSAIGEAMRRKEDPRMITGRGQYIDDIALPGMLWMALVRSPEAHARIVSIDKSAAEARPGVVGVFTGDDLAGDFAASLPMVWDPPGVEINTPDHWPLARGERLRQNVGDLLGDRAVLPLRPGLEFPVERIGKILDAQGRHARLTPPPRSAPRSAPFPA